MGGEDLRSTWHRETLGPVCIKSLKKTMVDFLKNESQTKHLFPEGPFYFCLQNKECHYLKAKKKKSGI